MAEPAFESDELQLSEAEKVGARMMYAQFGPPSEEVLIKNLRRIGHKADGYLETALGLPLDAYKRVLEVYKSLPAPPQRSYRRRKARR